MKAVIMAAGAGTRLRPLTEKTPKPLLDLGNEKIIERSLKNLPKEIDEVFLIVGYLGEMIKNYLGDNFRGRRLNYIWQKELKGTWHAASLARDYLDAKFLVLNGDDIYDPRALEEMIGYDWTILAYPTNNFKGDSLIFSVDNNLEDMKEIQDENNLKNINTGAYAIQPEFFDYPPVAIKGGQEYGLPHTLVSICDKHEIKVVHTNRWQQINTPEQLETARKLINQNML